MKVEDLAPTVTSFKNNQELVASTWRIKDSQLDSLRTRSLYHYDTLMAEFHSAYDHQDGLWDGWTTKVVSTGWGSQSDANGMNSLLKVVGSAIRFSRKGGTANYVGPNGNVIELPRH